MSKIWVSGLMNVETTARVGSFPVEYSPIEYNFFGVKSSVSGVGVNVCTALKTLGDDVSFASLVSDDMEGRNILSFAEESGLDTKFILPVLKATPTSLVLYDGNGRRKIYCDLKDIQDRQYPVSDDLTAEMKSCTTAVICNINFNRPLLKIARINGLTIATDVHVLSDINDEYNREFMENAHILFLSNENIRGREEQFITSLAERYQNLQTIVLGRGSEGAAMYLRKTGQVKFYPAIRNEHAVNTCGAGDALFSCFIHFQSKGIDEERCLNLAQLFASRKIAFDGGAAGFSTEEELLAL